LVILYEKGLKIYAVVIRVLHILFRFFTMMLNSNARCSKYLTIILQRSDY